VQAHKLQAVISGSLPVTALDKNNKYRITLNKESDNDDDNDGDSDAEQNGMCACGWHVLHTHVHAQTGR
jgi:hypothetical protein